MKREPELIEMLIQGSEVAFGQIYEIYSGRLYNYCFNYSKSKEIAEEVVQDTFVKLWINREKIVNNSSIGALLFVIAKHQLINIYRQNINSPIYEEYIKYNNTNKLSVNDTSEIIEYEDFYQAIKRGMALLPRTQRKIFECCKMKQMSGKEAAAELGLSEQTIKNQLSLAIKFLKEQLQKIPILVIF